MLKALQDRGSADLKEASPCIAPPSHQHPDFGDHPSSKKPDSCPISALPQSIVQSAELENSPHTCRADVTQQIKTIEIDGTDVTFDIATVPDPPAISFADDVPRLLREWYVSSHLTIAGRGIPVRHWDKFYMNRGGVKHGAWASFRSTWHNWKVSGVFCWASTNVAQRMLCSVHS
jgi:hypothetical protein